MKLFAIFTASVVASLSCASTVTAQEPPPNACEPESPFIASTMCAHVDEQCCDITYDGLAAHCAVAFGSLQRTPVLCNDLPDVPGDTDGLHCDALYGTHIPCSWGEGDEWSDLVVWCCEYIGG